MKKSRLYFKHFLTDVNASNSYVIGCPQSGHSVLIDPADYNDEIKKYLQDNSLSVEYIFITHNHYDHNQDVDEVLKEHDAKIINGIANPVKEPQKISCGSMNFQVYNTPGHTVDSVTYLINDMIFVGDLLFAGAVGGTSDINLHLQEIEQISEKILTLPDGFKIYPGHGPASTVRIEKTYNPFLIDKDI